MFKREGPFWDVLREVRAQWGITPATQVPPKGNAGVPPLPPTCAGLVSHWEWSRLQSSVPYTTGYKLPLDDLESHLLVPLQRWLKTLHDIHAAVVPKEHRIRKLDLAPLERLPHEVFLVDEEQRYSAEAWEVFLANCVLYDPPDVALLEFVRLADGDPQEARQSPPPIVWQRDAELAAETERWYSGRYFEDFSRTVALFLEQRGLSDDFWRFEEERKAGNPLGPIPEVEQEYRERLAQNPARPSIVIGPQTSDDDVREALRWIATSQRDRRGRGRPPRDPLTAVQCAIWRDRYRWTNHQIAKHLGWPTTKDDYGVERHSNRASQHVRLGRQILRSKKSAQ